MKEKFFTLLLLLTLLLVAVSTVGAQEPIEPTPMEPIMPPIDTFDGLRIEYQRVDVTIEEQVATTHIEQLFVNPNDWMLEGTYLFPLPEGAAVNELTMWVDGQAIDAKILEAGEARDIYDQIVRQLRDPALLEYVGHDAIQANVFPIPAQDERLVEIEYSQVLSADNGLIRYTYLQSGDLYTRTPLESQSIHVQIESRDEIRAVYSPSHAVAVKRDGPFAATVGYEENNVRPAQDFELYYTVSPEDIGLNVLSYKEPGEDGFFLLLVAPTVQVDPDEIVARDVVLVLDTSGSMEGQKLAQAKEAAHYVVDHLNERDRFNIVTFSTGVRSYAPQLTAAEDAAEVHTFIDRLEALGGTNISLALLEALQQGDGERPLTILFLTDGLATEGIVETPLLLQTIKDAAPASARIFSFGVGHDVDTQLLGSLSENHRGTTTYVRPEQAIDEAVSSFYAKVSTPVLANVSLEVDGVTIEQTYPAELTDLFAGTQMVIAGRYRQGGPATVTLRGDVNGEPQTFVYEDVTFRESGGDAFIPRLWATRAIGHLLQQIRLHGENNELVQSVVDLSIRYGIITPYTSFLIEEDDILTQSGRQNLVEESMAEEEEPMEVSGFEAVEGARAEGELAAADAPAPLPTTPVGESLDGDRVTESAVQSVGSKTFVYRDGVWIDTAYDADAQQPQRVSFVGEQYFELLSAAPEIGQYLSLGPHVIVVFQGNAYEVVEGDGEADETITFPDATDAGDEEVVTVEPTPANNAGEDSEAVPAARTLPCAAILILPFFLGGLALVSLRRR